MNRTSARRIIAPSVAALALGLALTACGAGNESNNNSDGDSGSGDKLSGTLQAGGASSQEKAQAAWVAGVQDANPDLTINYEPVGSGDGRANFISGGYAVAGSDSMLSDDELTAATDRCSAEPLQLLAYVGPIAVAYNLPSVDKLTLDATTMSDIWSGKITKWNDPAIAAGNDGVDLPDTTISPVHRSDDSGTQKTFTSYLAEHGGWSHEPEGVWPSDLSGEGADGTAGVAGAVKAGEGTIAFLDSSAALANSLTTAEVAGDPIELRSWLIACPSYEDANQASLVKGYLSYVFSADGQQAAADEAGIQPLDEAALSEATAQIDAIS
ncbi:MAG: phosphate ABC transporter substrate-binding protein PstS [Nocardioidaceae bacterium]|nr:MAG: phosphate ABC transporter substrate-binding protein PstS [Nocardioidaceae bacterium]